MKNFILILFLFVSYNMYAQESLGEILKVETNVSFDELPLAIDNVDTESYNEKLYTYAEEGNSAAQNYLGQVFLHGAGVLQNRNTAKYWIQKSADQNNPKGLATLGYLYEFGLGVEKDMQKAVELYRKSALMGNPGSWTNLGNCYEEGKGVPVDNIRAKAWYEKGARYGFRVAQIRLVNMLISDKNYHDALYWIWRAASQKSSVAFEMLADFYEAGIILPKDMSKAIICKQKAVSLQTAPSTTAIFDSSYDFNIDISSISNSDIIGMINKLLK